MGTPQNDSSWAGWAISSFTNKLATVSGEMQQKTSMPEPQPHLDNGRPSSVPPVDDTSQPARASSSSAPTLHRKVLIGNNPSAPALTRTSTDQFFSEAQDEDDELDQAWGDMDDAPFFSTFSGPALKPDRKTSSVAYDDGGEPDFEGWLNAQAQAKTKNSLPKGLPKSPAVVNNRPSAAANRKKTSGSLSSSAGATKVTNTGVKPKATTVKAISTKLKEASVEDDWGEAWD